MSQPLSFLIKPSSYDCNLACDYCFYRKTSKTYSDTGAHRMSLETVGVLAEKAQAWNEQAVGYIWQGGEPMIMGLDFFRNALRIQEEKRRPGQVITNTIQTNGVLIDDRWAEFFARNGFLVGISIDGPRDLHDLHRFDHARASVYDLVENACAFLKKHGVEFNILAVVNRDNASHAREIYRYFRDAGFTFLQFIPCIECEDGRIMDFSLTPEQYGRFLCELFDEWVADGYPSVCVRLFDNLLQHYAGRVPECCMFQDRCGGYLLVEHNGDVYPCDFFVSNEWLLGSIIRDSLGDILTAERYQRFASLKSAPRRECGECRWLTFCNRGCIKFRHLPAGDYGAQNYYCAAYRTFFEYSDKTYRFLVWDILRRHRGELPVEPGRNDPCVCGSGKKFKKCCEPFAAVMRR